MEQATWRLPKILRLALIGVATAFAWIVIAVLFGLTAGHAHADDSQADDDGLLGAVTSLVDRTTSGVSDVVTSVTAGATSTVNHVIDVAPAPVQQPVREAVQTVGSVATTVTAPASDIVADGVVGGVTAPVVELVTNVPVIGGIVAETGVDDALTDLIGSVDSTLGATVRAVGETATSIGRPSSGGGPSIPAIPGLPGDGDASEWTCGPADVAAAPIKPDDAVTSPRTSRSSGRGDASASDVSAAPLAGATASTAVPLGGAPAAGLCPPATMTGPGGAGSGAWALAALLPLAAHRAWVRRAGREDDDVPPAPVGSTDVSPD